jgi:hypothetical protein
MFVSQHVPLPVSLRVAEARLVRLATQGGLGHVARTAYEDGAELLIRVGPLGQVPGTSKLVRALFLDPVTRDSTVTIGMRWEATGFSGGLFPVLDANISVAAADGGTAVLSLEGTYRPPFGSLGAGLDKAMLNRVATATIRALLRDVASALSGPAERAGPQEACGSGFPDRRSN